MSSIIKKLILRLTVSYPRRHILGPSLKKPHVCRYNMGQNDDLKDFLREREVSVHGMNYLIFLVN